MVYRISAHTEPADIDLVRQWLGREPLSRFEVVVRNEADEPVVIRNDPFLADGTPMPTRYWLVGPAEVAQIGRLESTGGVRAAEAAVGADALRAAHDRYAEMRDRAISSDHSGPRPTGGVGGTREGVKCLHAHYAWYLVGGDDPVGAWVQEQLDHLAATVTLEIDTDIVRARNPHRGEHLLESTPALLLSQDLTDADPPDPASLTNALGSVEDDLVQMLLAHPDAPAPTRLVLTGRLSRALAHVEIGSFQIADTVDITRDDLEDVFRTLATESREDRVANPGLHAADVDLVLAAACIAVSAVRTWALDRVTVA